MTTDTYLANAHDYSMSWSRDDQEFVATCADFPSLSWLSTSADDAVAGLQSLVAEVVDDMTVTGERVPEPGR